MSLSKKTSKYSYDDIKVGYYDKVFKKKKEYKVHGIILSLIMLKIKLIRKMFISI